MKQKIQTTTLALLLLLGSGTALRADEITLSFTGDNLTQAALCLTLECDGPLDAFAITPNWADWTQSDSLILDLAPGTYSFLFAAENDGVGGSGNPGGLLGQILGGKTDNYTSSSWHVTTDYTDSSSWVVATEYGSNGGTNIWSSVLGGPVAGISTSANWIWSSPNFQEGMDQVVYFRTSIKVVSEPGTLALLGFGLIVLAVSRRRRNRG